MCALLVYTGFLGVVVLVFHVVVLCSKCVVVVVAKWDMVVFVLFGLLF